MNHFHLQASTMNRPAIAYGRANLDQKTRRGKTATKTIAGNAVSFLMTSGIAATVRIPAIAKGSRITNSELPKIEVMDQTAS
jgi:hypothetical protein